MLQFPSDRRRIKAGCLGAVLCGAITLCLLLNVGDYALNELIVSATVTSSLGAILSVAASDPDRLQPSRFSFLANVISSIPVSLLLIFPVVALYAFLFELPIPLADVKPGRFRRVIGSPLVLIFFGAAQRQAAQFLAGDRVRGNRRVIRRIHGQSPSRVLPDAGYDGACAFPRLALVLGGPTA